MNIMLETANLDNHPYLSGAVYSDGSEESIWLCPECAKRGVESNLLYNPGTQYLACPCQDCSGEYTHEEYARAAFDAMSRVADLENELGDERKARMRIAEMARAIAAAAV